MFEEIIEIQGHIIDALLLPKILDEVLNRGGAFEIIDIHIGKLRRDPSQARIRVQMGSREDLDELLGRLKQLGATVAGEGDCLLSEAPADGVFPEGFYVTTNYQTFIRQQGEWIEVSPSRMDCGIRWEPEARRASTSRFGEVRQGDFYVVGHEGIRVIPLERNPQKKVFEFMASSVSSEKPKAAVIREVAHEIRQAKHRGQKVLVVAGPAVVHTGAGSHLVRMIEKGYVDLLFAGNALAVHDIEQNLFGTSLGIDLSRGMPAVEGHENHIRAINAVRQAGGVRQAVQSGLITGGIMHACVKYGVDWVLAGSIRDDGPLPEVITDSLEAQAAMQQRLRGAGVALMVSSALHAIATGNLLPAATRIVVVDINPAVVTKLVDRGSFQSLGIITDAGLFFQVLLAHLLEEG